MPPILTNLYDRVILRRPLISVFACLLLVGALGSQLGEIVLDASADTLVLEGDADLDYFREIGERYSSEEFLVITYQPDGDLLGDDSLATLESLRDELAAIEDVSGVTTLLDVPLLQSPPIALADVGSETGMPTLRDPGIDRELVRVEFRESPIYEQLLVSPDGKTAAIQVNLRRDEEYFRLLDRRESLRQLERAGTLSPQQTGELREAEREFKAYSAKVMDRASALVAEVREVVDGYRNGASLFVGGVPMIAADMVSFVRSDLVTFGAGILGFMLVMLSVIFRKPRYVALPMTTVIASAAVMLGLLAWLDWRMTVISSNFVAVLLIVGLAIAIHLVVRYRELHMDRPEAEQHELVLETVRLMAVPCFYTTLTTAVAFTSLVVSGLRPVIDFGWMMTIGICIALLLTFVLLPCLLVMLPKGTPSDRGERSAGMTPAFARFTERHGSGILLVSGLLVATSIYGISRLQVENRFIDYFHESTEIYQGMELLDAQLGGTIPLDIIIDVSEEELGPVFAEDPGAQVALASSGAEEVIAEEDDFGEDDMFDDDFDGGFVSEEDEFEQSYWFTTRGMERLQEIHEYVDSLPQTGKVLSLATTYSIVKQLWDGGVGDVELALVQKSLPDAVANLIVDPYFDEETEQARISLRVKETSRDLRRDQFLTDLHAHLVDELGVAPDNLRFTNMLVLYNNVLQSLFKSQILTLGAVFAAIVFMFVLLFRSFSLALIAVAPNILAAAMVLGAMGLTGVPLDIMTITIAAIVVGIGVDDTIHYVHRFKREFPRDRNYLATMHRCHASIGRAMYYTSITIVVGFSILVFSNFTPSIYFGLLTGLAMLVALIGALLLLPQLIITFQPLGPEADS
ncbi:MAG: MMPL family transporter [Halieaceae bacterium]